MPVFDINVESILSSYCCGFFFLFWSFLNNFLSNRFNLFRKKIAFFCAARSLRHGTASGYHRSSAQRSHENSF